ncbi:ATP-binding protein [Paenibacillus agricola]|uniref:ATP-binding protein n=1 Tax=Paenibacillus agricola TaxID=2716264 RepID=A0ABX0J9R6_9BACL|nr:ATP-binding protein [Paenibacillus agricola]NHN31617.1 ATP-binding protein [Paenibacillus agricola]
MSRANVKSQFMFSPSLRGSHVKAMYIQQEIEGYKGNPFIEALPPIFEEEYVAKAIAKRPAHTDEQRKLGKQTRLHLVQQISDYVEVLPIHLTLEQRLSRLIRHGYKARNPFTTEYVRQFNVGFQELLNGGVDEEGRNMAGVRSTAASFAVLGVSGQGKTTSIESTLLLYPQVVEHTSYNGNPFTLKQLVWLKLNCPFDGSLKGLCINFFQAVDAQLGTNYFQKFVSRGVTVDILIPNMAQIATLHGLGVLVIDEIQNLSTMKSGGAEKMLNYFTQLINTIGVPVITVGTYKAVKLLSGSFSQARRSTGQGDLIIDRLTQGEEWNYFIEGLWRYQWTSEKCPLTAALKDSMYVLTQGIVDIAVKLYMLAQWEAIDGSNKITSSLLKETATRHMRLVQPILKLLKGNNPETLSLVDDLYPQWNVMDDFLRNSSEKTTMYGHIRNQTHRTEKVELDQDKLIELVKTALDFGADSDKAEKIAEYVIQQNETERDIVALRKEVVNLLQQNSNDKPKEAKKRPSLPSRRNKDEFMDPDDLRQALKVTSEKEDIYSKLADAGNVPTDQELEKLIFTS